jgi:ubiquinone/menaquinone biosynthesis C-methylase UbiE
MSKNNPSMVLDPVEILQLLGNPVRKAIVSSLIIRNEGLRFSELMYASGLNPNYDTGHFGYHLSELRKRGMITKTRTQYHLSKLGVTLSKVLDASTRACYVLEDEEKMGFVGARTSDGSGEKTQTTTEDANKWRERLAKAFQERNLDEDVPELKPYLPRGGRVLDVGCGSGGITLGVAAAVAPGTVVGIDPNPNSIQIAEQMAKERGISNVSFQVGDGSNLDLPDNTFDVAYSHTVLHLVIDPIKVLNEQQRVVKQGGWVIAAGIRDWGLSPRYPECKTVDKVYEAWERYHESLYTRYTSGQYTTKPLDELIAASDYFDLFSGRKCPEWFSKAGLTDLNVQIKVFKMEHPGAENMELSFLDFMPPLEETDHPIMERYKPIFAEGFLNKATYEQARAELIAWYQHPYAFHYWALVFAAGKV